MLCTFCILFLCAYENRTTNSRFQLIDKQKYDTFSNCCILIGLCPMIIELELLHTEKMHTQTHKYTHKLTQNIKYAIEFWKGQILRYAIIYLNRAISIQVSTQYSLKLNIYCIEKNLNLYQYNWKKNRKLISCLV